MAKDASQYPITYGYLARTTINGLPYVHRGEDRAMNTGTPVIVNGTQIGLSGNTGKSTGPHLHLQCGKDKYAQTTIKPTTHWFKGQTVVETGTASEWGNFVIVKNSTVYCVYAHLSKITVKAGDKLGGDMKRIQQLEKALATTRKALKTVRATQKNTQKALAEATTKVTKLTRELKGRPTKAELLRIQGELEKINADLKQANEEAKNARQSFITETINKIKELLGWN